MPILAGAASLTRFNVASMPASPTFDEEGFREIAPGSEVRESIGFVPFEPQAPYEVAAGRWAFRVRIDTLRPDPTSVAERLRDLLRTEQEISGKPFVGPKKRRELRNLAQEEMILRAVPRSRIIEAVIDDGVLLVGSTADSQLGKVVTLLRKVGVVVDFKTPWLDLGEPEAESEILELHDPVRSAHGAHFLEALLGDPEIKFEPVSGYARLQTRQARVTITGAILRELQRYVQEGAALLAAKLLTADVTFRLDALTFRLSSLSIENSRLEHWTERLDERLEKITTVWELLDRKYAELSERSRRRGPSRILRAEDREWSSEDEETAGVASAFSPDSE